jgi:hypothetical protein
MNALREQLRGRDPYYLQALLKNGDSDDPLVRAAYAELSARGQVPEYAEGLFDSPAGDMPDNLAASATPIAVDPDVKITSFGRRVVGPRTATGNAPVPGEYFQSEDEAEAYYNRGIDPKTGDVIASGADEGMLERGFRPVYKADGTVGYAVASGTEGMSTGNAGSAPVNRAYQEQLMRPTVDADGKPSGPFPKGRFRQDTLPGPLGASTEVMVPTDETREYNARLNERRQKLNYLDRMERDKPGFDRSTAEIPETQEERYFAEESARRSRRASSEAERRAMAKRVGGSQNINAGNAEAIRDLVNMDPTRREELVADNMGPRNVQYRFNPRTGQVEFGSQRAYPPSENADARSLEMMMRENARRELVNQQREQSLIPLRAEVQRLASADGWGNAGLPRAEARRRLIASGLYPADLIDLALDEAYGRGAPDAATIPEGVVPDSPVDPTPSLVPMPGPDGAGTGMPYNYRY